MEPVSITKKDEALIYQNLEITNSALSVLEATADELEKWLVPVISLKIAGQTPYHSPPLGEPPGESPLAGRIRTYNDRLNTVIDHIQNLVSRLQI